jgi:trans-aconitate methyltransferase
LEYLSKMKLSIKYENQDIKEHKDFVSEFIKLLQKEYPLKQDLKIIFMDGKRGRCLQVVDVVIILLKF